MIRLFNTLTYEYLIPENVNTVNQAIQWLDDLYNKRLTLGKTVYPPRNSWEILEESNIEVLALKDEIL